jgi:hypothetical protein
LIGSDLGEFAAGAQRSERDRRIGPRGDHEVQRFGRVVEQELHQLATRRLFDEVVVVEHKRRRRLDTREVVDE